MDVDRHLYPCRSLKGYRFASAIHSVGGGKVLFLLIINLAFLFLGSVLEGVPALIMTVPRHPSSDRHAVRN